MKNKFIKTTLVDFLNENKINEYFTNDIVYLKDYFKTPKSTKISYLPHEYSYFFQNFLDETDTYFERPDDIDDDYELMDWLENNDKDIFNEFADYLYDRISNHELDISDSEYPAWTYFSEYPEIIKNQWLIHFTNDAQNIAKDGFKYGVDDMTKLGLTTQLGEFDKKFGGYNFAFTLGDFDRYGRSSYSGRFQKYKYGNEAVVFNASGIKVWHYGDEEPQVIFYGNTVKNIIPIISGEKSEYAIYNKNGRILFEDDDLTKVVEWITTNYQQYRKNLR